MYPRRLLTALGIAAFFCSLLWGMPARIPVSALWPAVPAQDVGGTVAAGSVRLVRGGTPLTLDWELRPWRLLLLQAAADWHLGYADATAEGAVRLAPWGGRLVVAKADVPAATLSRWVRRWQATVDQPLQVRGMVVALSPRGGVLAADGTAAWGGGEVRVAGRAPLALPALRGRLAPVDDGMEFVVDGEQAPGAVLARARYDAGTGEVYLVLVQRGADLLGMRARNGRDAETPVFELRQRLRE